jgi:DNA-binding GntR family transcriptional regulator
MQPNSDLPAIAESHAPILQAVERGDVELACRLSREHQEYFERRA